MSVRDATLTRLGNCDQIVTGLDGWDAVFLDRGWDIISTQLNIAQHGWMKTCILECADGCNTFQPFLSHIDLSDPRNMLSVILSRIDQVLFLLVEVDPLGIALLRATKQNGLEFWVLGANVAFVSIPLIDPSIAVPVTVSDFFIVIGSLFHPDLGGLGGLTLRAGGGSCPRNIRRGVGITRRRKVFLQVRDVPARHRDGGLAEMKLMLHMSVFLQGEI